MHRAHDLAAARSDARAQEKARHVGILMNATAEEAEPQSYVAAFHQGMQEAGWSLGMSRFQTFWYVVLIPSLQRIWPALSSQIVLVMLGSAVVSQIAAEDLSFAANFIQSRNFRAFEIYFLTTAIYLVLAILLRQVLSGVGWWLFPRKAAR